MIGIRIAAKERWRQRKKNKKCVEHALQLASSSQLRGKSPEPTQRPDKPSKKPDHEESMKEIDP